MSPSGRGTFSVIAPVGDADRTQARRHDKGLQSLHGRQIDARASGEPEENPGDWVRRVNVSPYIAPTC